MESKLLDLNTDKSCFIVMGKKQVVKDLRNDLQASPLTLCGMEMKEKVSDKYLGDYIHSGGPGPSVHCTISNRYGRIILGIIETRAIVDDCRINVVGGLQSGLDFWEMAYLPNLLNNCQTWTDISEDSIKMLDDIQSTMYRVLLGVPKTCPIPALCWELGGIQMRYRIAMKKLTFIWHLQNLEEKSLAKEILQVQKVHHLPGLVRECEDWMAILKLPNLSENTFSKQQWKTMVKHAISKENEEDLRLKMMSMDKLKNSDMIKEKCEVKEYVKTLSVTGARTIFKKRASMTRHVKMNYMSEAQYVKDIWMCDSCLTQIDSMHHVLWCPSYRELRIDKNMDDDRDVARYLHDVMEIRSKLEIRR